VARWLRSRLPTRCWTAFTFYMRFPLGGGSTLTFRGEVYAWDGAKPTGPNLWESAALTVTLSSSSKPLPSTRAEYHSSPASDTSCSEHLQGLRTERQDYEQNARTTNRTPAATLAAGAGSKRMCTTAAGWCSSPRVHVCVPTAAVAAVVAYERATQQPEPSFSVLGVTR
jgi:hypothetical protein